LAMLTILLTILAAIATSDDAGMQVAPSPTIVGAGTDVT